MAKFIKEVFPHMLSPNMTHIHPLDESMYGGTLTLGDKEVSFGQIMFGKISYISNSEKVECPITWISGAK